MYQNSANHRTKKVKKSSLSTKSMRTDDKSKKLKVKS